MEESLPCWARRWLPSMSAGIPIGVTIEKCECLDDHRNGTVKFRACSRNSSHCSRACECRAIHAPPSTKPASLAASALVVNAIVFDGPTLRLAVPDGNWDCGLGLEHDLSDRIADELCDTAPRARRGHAQRDLPCGGKLGSLPCVSLYWSCRRTSARQRFRRGRIIWIRRCSLQPICCGRKRSVSTL